MTAGSKRDGLMPSQRFIKRAFDILFSAAGLAILCWLIVPAIIAARFDTGQSGIYRQRRVGLHGRYFNVMKIRTMQESEKISTVVTTANDPRITRFGRFLRRVKFDELPQLFNILRGDMSFVGPRPDVPEYMDRLTGGERVILSVRPGVTGPATIKYRNEEQLLAGQENPRQYNDDVIFPDKVRINRRYVENYSFIADLRYIWSTLFFTATE
jgi:lipopolysaccharide/colanic/teichoic acid biosynthesis glycosyltransferase